MIGHPLLDDKRESSNIREPSRYSDICNIPLVLSIAIFERLSIVVLYSLYIRLMVNPEKEQWAYRFDSTIDSNITLVNSIH